MKPSYEQLEAELTATKIELAEKNLRKLVIWRKKSFGTRSDRGQKFVERITSISETVKRHGKNVLRFIQDTVVNFFAEKPTPYICESLEI